MNTFSEAIVLSGFQTLDFIIFGVYVILIISLGMFISRNRGEQEMSASNYFLADNTLTWWAVGASLIAANISAEQFIGMAGTAFADGIAAAAYEIMAAVMLIVIAKFLLPIMMERKIFTMPQFLRERYNDGVGLAFSIFWLFLFVFVNLTSVAWLGALAIEQIFNLQGLEVDMGIMTVSVRMLIVFGLFIIAGLYSINGGQASVAWTDVMQVTFFVGGGLITVWIVLQEIGNSFGTSAGGVLVKIYDEMISDPRSTEHLHLIIQRSHNPEAFFNVPGIAAVVGAVMLTNLAYWGFNQYIVQKGLAAQNINEARKGMLFAAFLKLLIPFIVVLPGLCAYYVYRMHPEMVSSLNLIGDIEKSDYAYPWLIRNFAPTGIKGLAFVALVAAIISSLASMLNSTSTIFTMDIYKKYVNPKASDKILVNTGRITSLFALVLAFIASKPLFGDLDQAFMYIQENSAIMYPGIVVVFGFGLLWKRASATAAVWTAVLTLPLGIAFKLFMGDIPFMVRATYVFILECVFFVTLSLSSRHAQPAELPKEKDRRRMLRWAFTFSTVGLLFVICSLIVAIMGNSTPLTAYLNDIGFQAFIFFGVLLGGNGLWLYSNSKDTISDPKAVTLDLSLFHTTRGYTYGTIGILLISFLFYVILW